MTISHFSPNRPLRFVNTSLRGYLDRNHYLLFSQHRKHFNSNAKRCHVESWNVPSGGQTLKQSLGVPSGRSCLVTGGASGIGFQISKQLILNGASSVLIVTRSATKAQSAIERIKHETEFKDAPIGFVECDFMDGAYEFLQKWTEYCKDHPSRLIDTLINCAGISQTQALLTTSSEKVSQILQINLEVPIELSKHMLKEYFTYGKRLSKDPSSQARNISSFCVVNVSSLLANRGGYGSSIYATSKAGLTAFTRTLALEAATARERFPTLPPFRTNAVLPGYIDTPMIESFSQTQKQKLESDIPLRRYGTAEEVADAVMFLLRNEYANNTVLNLDGGLSAT